MPKLRMNSPAFALMLLLGLNLLNYADRSVLSALEAKMEPDLLGAGDPNAKTKMGSLMLAFLVTYMVLAPVFGILADRWKRWWIVGLGVIGGGVASFGTGLSPMMAPIGVGIFSAFGAAVLMRALVGVSESAYGPAAPTLISDLFPMERRGRALAWFYLAIPVGSALGYVYGGLVGSWLGWQWAFYLLLPPAIVLGVLAMCMPEPRRGASDGGGSQTHKSLRAMWSDALALFKIKSLVWNGIGGIAMTFAIGGLAFWIPRYLALRMNAPGVNTVDERILADVNIKFGAITVVAGIAATLLGGLWADKLRAKYGGAYLSMSGWAMMLGFPAFLGVLWLPFPWAWVMLALTVFLVFLNTGPTNTALANVTQPSIRATAFALNIFFIHALGDAISPMLIGAVADARQKAGEPEVLAIQWGFGLVAIAMVIAGIAWLVGARWVQADTEAVSGRK